jgi:diaminohydroxyphosphoribosylaminopyrimidine deaminase/5-amino-6-(5-phosphoribosylamino)uracil reductase
MRSALRLAKRGLGSVEPNPAVGAIIVKEGKVIGRGRHKKFGGPHAEINALEDCKKTGNDPRGAQMYVTLEPCCHQGKTGPCTQAIISAGLAKVFVAMIDPSKHTSGKGIEQLRDAGIEVQTGICEVEARLLNSPFIKYAVTGKCWVTLKWAQSIDGKLAMTEPQTSGGNWISGQKSRKDVHKLRRRISGILVGINTVITDDPLLTARPGRGKKALRIVLDNRLRIPLSSKLIKTAKRHPLLIYTRHDSVSESPKIVKKIAKKGIELLTHPQTAEISKLHFLIDELSKRDVGHLLVEGGPGVLTSFLKEGLADEVVIYIAPKILGAQGCADITGPMAELAQTTGLHYVDVERFGDDVRLRGFTSKALSEISVPLCR